MPEALMITETIEQKCNHVIWRSKQCSNTCFKGNGWHQIVKGLSFIKSTFGSSVFFSAGNASNITWTKFFNCVFTGSLVLIWSHSCRKSCVTKKILRMVYVCRIVIRFSHIFLVGLTEFETLNIKMWLHVAVKFQWIPLEIYWSRTNKLPCTYSAQIKRFVQISWEYLKHAKAFFEKFG